MCPRCTLHEFASQVPHPTLRMTAHNEDDLMQALESELESMSGESAERLSNILRGLFTCMQDLNTRLAALERQDGDSNERGR